MRRDIERGLISWGSGSEPQTLTGKFCFDEQMSVFKGHFPEMPLVPGVMQIEMIRFLVEKATGHPQRIVRIKKAKFIGQILPGNLIELTLGMTTPKDALRVKARLTVNGHDVSNVIMDLSPAEP